ncbi:MAG: hypothetical protein RI945_67 [Candidatus Parcubacteria bacterium]|jgi:poly-gamma-glutamate synthesis protein (capsule biosynthesis protein)
MKKKYKSLIAVVLLIALFAWLYFLNKEYIDNLGMGNYVSTQRDLKKSEIGKSELNILFVGDIMLDRKIRKIISESGSLENFVSDFLSNFSKENKNYDYIAANLEGPITENRTKTYNPDGSYTGLLTFTFPTSTAKILNLLNIKVVSIANNHTDNFGNVGLQDTKRFLEEGSIKYFGNPYNDNQKESLSNIICEKSICIAYVGYHEFAINYDSQRIEEEIQKLKQDTKVDFIIIFPHWGTEYRKTSNQNQKNLAHKWIDVGGDMVIGMHPHVIEESEVYGGKYIYYSLGNYIFDQWFSEEVKNGLAVNFKFKKEALENGEIKREIEFIKEIKVHSEKTEVGYILE